MRAMPPVLIALLVCLSAVVVSPPAHAQILACGTTLSGPVTLTADVVCQPGMDGLIVGDHKVRIELNGFNIVGPYSAAVGGPSATGISSAGFESVQIVGPGTIKGFRTPFEIDGGNNHLVSGIEATELWGDSARIRNSSGSLVENSRITRLEIASDHGSRATANRIVGNEIGADPADGGGGIALRGCDTADNVVSNNYINAGQAHAVSVVNGANGNQILDNKMALGPIVIAGGHFNVVAGNSIWGDGTTFAGVEILSSFTALACAGGAFLQGSKNIVRDNRFWSGEYGVWIGDFGGAHTAESNLVTGNDFSDHLYAGLFFTGLAVDNDARGNRYTNVPAIAFDYGRGNLWP